MILYIDSSNILCVDGQYDTSIVILLFNNEKQMLGTEREYWISILYHFMMYEWGSAVNNYDEVFLPGPFQQIRTYLPDVL